VDAKVWDQVSTLEGIVDLVNSAMIEITIEIKQLLEDSKKAINVALRAKKTNDTPIERGMEERILPAVKALLRDSGLLGERAS